MPSDKKSLHGRKLPVLKMKEVHRFEIDSHDLDQFVQAVYEQNSFNFIVNQECGNDTSHSFSVDGKLDEWDVESIGKFIKTGKVEYMSNGAVLNDLAARGLIPVGNYLISVSW